LGRVYRRFNYFGLALNFNPLLSPFNFLTMFSINDFLDYASNGSVSSIPAPKAKARTPRRSSVTIQTPDQPVLPSSFAGKRTLPPPGPIMVFKYQPEPETIQVAPEMPPQTAKPALELVNYSERSFAIFGDTRAVKGQLDELGGKFNRFLKKDGVSTPGYIFSISRIDNVRKAMNI
jgi:hypothetical protein